MREWDKVYPQYGYEKHKGYGTAAHISAIKENGLCPLHRLSFVKAHEQTTRLGCYSSPPFTQSLPMLESSW